MSKEFCEDAVSRNAVKDKLRDYIVDLPSVTPTRWKGHNCNEDYADCDQFVCSNCGIELQDWHRVERDEDDGEVSYHEYTFKFCPNCGAEMGDNNE